MKSVAIYVIYVLICNIEIKIVYVETRKENYFDISYCINHNNENSSEKKYSDI